MEELIQQLRQSGSFPGALHHILSNLHERLTALEAHAPMLDSLKGGYQAHLEEQAAREAAQAAQDGPGDPAAENSAQPSVEPNPTPEGNKSE